MKRVEFAELPAALRAAIERFLYAWGLDDGRIIARHVVEKRARETEWNGRVLAREERALPSSERTRLEDATVVSTHYFEDDTCILRVVIEIDGIAKVDKQVYDPTPWTLSEIVREAVARARFPEEYAGWSRDEKVSYWARMIHRFRRVNGEDGRKEDEIYTLELVNEMRAVDPRVDELLPDVLGLVGWLEQTAREEAIAAFTAKTGIRLS